MSNKLLKLIIYILNTPLYWVSSCMPTSSNIWIFGAWFGEKYADNSKYLFEYVNQSHSEIRAIWFSTNKNVIRFLNQKGYEAYYTYSWRGYYLGAIAKFVFLSSAFTDVNQYVCSTKRTTIIQLWHGTPLKKIHFDDKFNTFLNPTGINHIIKSIKEWIFPFLGRDYDYMVSSSELVSNCYHSAFRINKKKILLTGYPRNDVFFNKINNGDKPSIVYMPTHRNEGEFDVTSFFSNHLESINDKLSQQDITLYIKLHYYHLNNCNINNLSNIIYINDKAIDQDIYTIINNFDILITDYSSIYFDYLLSNKPIIFAPFDLEEYTRKDRELYFNYNDVTAGPKCQNWDEVIVELIKFISGVDDYKKERQIINNRFNTFQDGNNSKRVVEFIKQQI